MPKLPLPAGLRKPSRPGERGNGVPGGDGAASPLVERAKEAPVDLVGWVDERTGASPFLMALLFRKVPKGTNWFYTLGSATLFAFVAQAITGLLLAMYHHTNVSRDLDAAAHITNDVFLGEFVRG